MQKTDTGIAGLTIYENFIPEKLHDAFVSVMKTGKGVLNRGVTEEYTFEDDNAFDDAFNPLINDTFKKLKALELFSDKKLQLGCTILGYKKNGYLGRHIDSPFLSGERVVVLSFNSPTIIRFYSEKGDGLEHRFLIPPRSMYIMQGEARHKWSHEICKDDTTFLGKTVEKTDRFALLLCDPGPLNESIVGEI